MGWSEIAAIVPFFAVAVMGGAIVGGVVKTVTKLLEKV